MPLFDKLIFRTKKFAFISDEWKGVLQGIREHRCSRGGETGCSGALRRNIHRLEKGLCFPVKKEAFGGGYIAETVALYRKAEGQDPDAPEVRWAAGVLGCYFEQVTRSADPRIEEAYNAFSGRENRIDPQRRPYRYEALAGKAVPSAADFESLCQKRVSCRWFERREVEAETVEYCLRAAAQAASACNRQPFRFVRVKTAALRKAVVELPLGTAGFGTELPELFVVVGDWSNFEHERDRHLIFIDASLAVSQLLLALVVRGCAGVPINWPDIPKKNEALRKLLGLRSCEMPIMLIGFGYPLPEALIPYSEKKSPAELMQEV